MWSNFRERWRGYGTFFHCAWVTIAGSVLVFKDQVDAMGIDIKSVVSQYVPAEDVGLVMIGLAALFGGMRLVTMTPPFKSQ